MADVRTVRIRIGGSSELGWQDLRLQTEGATTQTPGQYALYIKGERICGITAKAETVEGKDGIALTLAIVR